jgi:hypothetical protein
LGFDRGVAIAVLGLLTRRRARSPSTYVPKPPDRATGGKKIEHAALRVRCRRRNWPQCECRRRRELSAARRARRGQAAVRQAVEAASPPLPPDALLEALRPPFWKAVAGLYAGGGFTFKQLRECWKNYAKPGLKDQQSQGWTDGEDAALAAAAARHRNKWVAVAAEMAGRGEQACKQRLQKLQRPGGVSRPTGRPRQKKP